MNYFATIVATGFFFAGSAQAAVITFNDIDLAVGLSATVGGLNLNTSTVGGALSTIGSGTFTGLYVGINAALGTYELAFSEAIDSIEIEFDALSSVGFGDPETIFDFATSNGAVSVSFLAQFGTNFDGTTITSTTNDGQGIITFSGTDFTSFFFTHAQNPSQNGFVIERIVVNTTGVAAVPLPASGLLLLGAMGLLAARRRRAS